MPKENLTKYNKKRHKYHKDNTKHLNIPNSRQQSHNISSQSVQQHYHQYVSQQQQLIDGKKQLKSHLPSPRMPRVPSAPKIYSNSLNELSTRKKFVPHISTIQIAENTQPMLVIRAETDKIDLMEEKKEEK
eukprot:UN05417